MTTEEFFRRIERRHDDPAIKTLVATCRHLMRISQSPEQEDLAIAAITLNRPDPVESFKRGAARVAVTVYGTQCEAAKRLRIARTTLREWLKND